MDGTNLKIVLIGAGRLATNLGVALKKAGHRIEAVFSRTQTAADALAERLMISLATDDLTALPKDADIYIISVKDCALQVVVDQVTKGREGHLFVHTAGSMPLGVFAGHTEHYGVFYPMQTFSKERIVDFQEIPLFIEASDEHTKTLMLQLAKTISSNVYELSTIERKYLHLAAVFACNFTNHCYTLSADILARHGLPFDVMLPLIDETTRKVHEMHPQEAQTGPAIRWDENVIGMQSELLVQDTTMRRIYDLLSRSIHEKAIDKHDQLRLKEDTSHCV